MHADKKKTVSSLTLFTYYREQANWDEMDIADIDEIFYEVDLPSRT